MHQEVPHVSGGHHCAGELQYVPRRRDCDPDFMEHEAASVWDTMKPTEQCCTRYVRPFPPICRNRRYRALTPTLMLQSERCSSAMSME